MSVHQGDGAKGIDQRAPGPEWRPREQQILELERFAYNLSHDLKSPLVTIQGFLGHMRRSLEAGQLEQARADLTWVEEAADRMSSLLEELLRLSRISRMPCPWRTSMSPSTRRAVSAWRSEVRLTPSCAASCRSDGRRSPCSSRSRRMNSRIASRMLA